MRTQNQTAIGILLAVSATLIWSGNFIVARGVSDQVPPITLALLRWGCASLIMLPLGWKKTKADWVAINRHRLPLVFAALFGVTIFNTLVYVAGHYSSALSLALIGTTSSPVFSFILAAFFLKEKIPPTRLLGLMVCMAGILLLLSRGSWDVLLHFKFSKGDWWILGAALAFAIYNIMARKKPSAIAPVSYLSITFWIGTSILLPMALIEQQYAAPWHWDASLIAIVLYLGAGTSVAAFFCWNAAISKLGAARASIFGNLIPLFSSIEAVIILHEKIHWIHITSMMVIVAGLILANIKQKNHAGKTSGTSTNQAN